MTEHRCVVPAKFGHMNLAAGLSQLALPFERLSGVETVIDLSQLQFCDPVATVALAGFAGTAFRETKEPVRLDGWDPDGYLSRVGLKAIAGHKDDFPRRRITSDRLTNLLEVSTAQERARVKEDVLNVLDIRHDGARNLLGYCLEEMLRNVDDHADSPVNALLQAQYYDNREEVVIAIGDTGQGVLKSLRQWHSDLENDRAALVAAMQPGVSGRNTRKGTNAGLGLSVSSALVNRAGGTFQIATGDAVLVQAPGRRYINPIRNGRWPGVIVVMVVPRNESLDWERTFTEVMKSL